MKKALTTRNLLNFYPSWSEIRNNWQSVGAQFLNSFGAQLDYTDIYLEKMKRNSFLSTVNLDEIDWLFKVELPLTYTFTSDTTDSLQPTSAPPTVRGLVSNNVHNGYIDVELANENNIENLWYEAIPSRVDLNESRTGSDDLLHLPSTSFPYSGLLTHHLPDGGRLWIEATSGTQYITINDDNGKIDRGSVVITGTTRKGTKESETMVFPWNRKQPTLKEWKYITNVEVHNLEDEVSVEVRSADFAWGPYQSFYNLRWSDIDTKIDEFWDLGSIDTGSTLDLCGYISDEWQDLVIGFSSQTVKDGWELIDIDLSPISAVDIALQPFSNRAWIADASSIHCFSLDETMVSGIDFLSKKPSGSHFKLELSYDYYLYGEDIAFTPLHVRPVSEVDKYRIWYQAPDGTKYGLNQGTQVAYTTDFWQYPTVLKRELEGEITISSAVRGEYKIVLEAVYPDGTTHEDRLIVPIKYKQPLSSIDISEYISGTIVGIDFDSDQYLWVKTTSGYYKFTLHADLMIVDYENKILYFREDYDEVDVT